MSRNVFSVVRKEANKADKKLVTEKRYLFHGLLYLRHHHQILFSVIIALGVIFVWRGLWNLIDRYWIPYLPTFSDVTGIIVGALLLYSIGT